MEEATTLKQFTNASFQVKLYETSDTTEFVYGPRHRSVRIVSQHY